MTDSYPDVEVTYNITRHGNTIVGNTYPIRKNDGSLFLWSHNDWPYDFNVYKGSIALEVIRNEAPISEMTNSTLGDLKESESEKTAIMNRYNLRDLWDDTSAGKISDRKDLTNGPDRLYTSYALYKWELWVENITNESIYIQSLHADFFPLIGKYAIQLQDQEDVIFNSNSSVSNWYFHNSHIGRYEYNCPNGYELTPGTHKFAEFIGTYNEFTQNDEDIFNPNGWHYQIAGYENSAFHIPGHYINAWNFNKVIHEPTYSGNYGPVECIMGGQMVLTDKGYVAIEEIQKNDTIGNVTVLDVVKNYCDDELIKFPKDCFGLNVPSEDLWVTHDHIMYDPIQNTLENAGVMFDKYSFVELLEPPVKYVYNIVLSHWGLIEVHNMKCETLCPLNRVSMQVYSENKIDTQFTSEYAGCYTTNDITIDGNVIVPKQKTTPKALTMDKSIGSMVSC